MFQMPTSSLMMTTMLGFEVCAALGTAPPAIKKLEMASAPSVSFLTFAPKSIYFSFTNSWVVLPPREGCYEVAMKRSSNISTCTGSLLRRCLLLFLFQLFQLHLE